MVRFDRLTDFDFEYPRKLIAQKPLSRGASNLMVVDGPKIIDTIFAKLVQYLEPGDLLIFNDSKVIHSRFMLYTTDNQNNHQFIDLYLYEKINLGWRGFAKKPKKLHIGDKFAPTNGRLELLSTPSNIPYIAITANNSDGIEVTIHNLPDNQFFENYGHVPTPPYIKRHNPDPLDTKEYQTVYAANPGSVAAPTAGLHFSKTMMHELAMAGIDIDYITLHVGAGTFLPIKTDLLDAHKMHHETYTISEATAHKIQNAKRVIAVGTTVARSIESAYINGKVTPGTHRTNLFIKCGYQFNVVDALITNFHTPKSTLFVLVCAFAGYHHMHAAYRHAITKEYRLFSYGDAMFLRAKGHHFQ